MKVRLLKTEGQGHFNEVSWEVPELKPNQIRVEAIMTGVCRSDIDMMVGKFGPLPLHMQGHEGLGRIIDVGSHLKHSNLHSFKIGDIVATRGEPAYADVYNCDYGNFVVVPEIHPKYILEPVACGINLVSILRNENISTNLEFVSRVAVIGTGFLAWVAVNHLKKCYSNLAIEVISNSNRDLYNTIHWSERATVLPELTGRYDLIVDLSNQTEYLNRDSFNPNALVIIGSEKHPGASMNFSHLLWNNCKMFFPSPRDKEFFRCMSIAKEVIENGSLRVDRFWTRAYCRDTEWSQAFEDGLNRTPDYSRGYIWWKNG